MFNLQFSILESNDSKSLVITDTTGTGTSGWGGPGNPAVTDISYQTVPLGMVTLMIYITKTTVSGDTIYDPLNAYYLHGGFFTDPSELVFTITPSDLLVDGVAESGVTADSEIEDAVYEIQYAVRNGIGVVAESTKTILAYNQIKTKVYERLRSVNEIYNAYDSRSKEISDTLLQYTLLKSMEAMAYVALADELLDTLETIRKININGSNYTWQ